MAYFQLKIFTENNKYINRTNKDRLWISGNYDKVSYFIFVIYFSLLKNNKCKAVPMLLSSK